MTGESHDMVFRVRPGSTVYLPFNEHDKGGGWMKLDHDNRYPKKVRIDRRRFEILENGNLIIKNVTEEDSAEYSSSFSQYVYTSTVALSVGKLAFDSFP